MTPSPPAPKSLVRARCSALHEEALSELRVLPPQPQQLQDLSVKLPTQFAQLGFFCRDLADGRAHLVSFVVERLRELRR